MGQRADSNRVAFWRELIEGRRSSGLSVAQSCAEAGVSPASFYQWQRRLRDGAADTGDARPEGHAQPGQRTASRLVPVHIVPDSIVSHGGSASRSGDTGMLEVELPGDIRLRIQAGCDAATLQLVLSMLLKDGSREGGSC
jgi:hypothetical protein